uniref:TCF3 fusion partner n=1 Tax=Steinernema glaseri TaxID=37863 RepID=A0A1I7Y506_9BILA
MPLIREIKLKLKVKEDLQASAAFSVVLLVEGVGEEAPGEGDAGEGDAPGEAEAPVDGPSEEAPPEGAGEQASVAKKAREATRMKKKKRFMAVDVDLQGEGPEGRGSLYTAPWVLRKHRSEEKPLAF